MDDSVQADKIGDLDITDVFTERRDLAAVGTEVASLVEVGVQSADLMPGCLQHADHDGSDIAVVTGDEDLHGCWGTGDPEFSKSWARIPFSRECALSAQRVDSLHTHGPGPLRRSRRTG